MKREERHFYAQTNEEEDKSSLNHSVPIQWGQYEREVMHVQRARYRIQKTRTEQEETSTDRTHNEISETCFQRYPSSRRY